MIHFELIFVKDVRCLDFFFSGFFFFAYECPFLPAAFVEETTLSIELPLLLFQDQLTPFMVGLFLSSPFCPRFIHFPESV